MEAIQLEATGVYIISDDILSDKDIERFDDIMVEKDHFAGVDSHGIVSSLREMDFSQEEIRKFGHYFLKEGIENDWLLDALGF